MVYCVVIGCSNKSDRNRGVSFYRIPKIAFGRSERELELSRKRREGYLAAISRADITDSVIENGRICSDHFLTGKPAALFDDTSPNWLPTENLGHSKVNRKRVATCQERYQRKKARFERLNDQAQQTPRSEAGLVGGTCNGASNEDHSEPADDQQAERVSSEVQTEVTSQDISQMQQELISAYHKINVLEAKLNTLQPFTEANLQDDDRNVHFYTGLPNFKLLKTVFEFVSSGRRTNPAHAHVLYDFQEFVATLIKLRLNPPLQDLAYRFGISLSTMSRIVSRWVTIMDIRLRPLILWPDRPQLRLTMPKCFLSSFGDKVAVVIDCFEVFIERPSNLLARACTWSSYKHHNTVKLLIGITPQGVVSFISQAWGGRVSDKYLTEHCGILAKLLPGDVVLADRGFDVADSVGIHQAKLNLPAFTRGKDQLTPLEVEKTRSIANVRIHVERVIGCVRQKYTILSGTIPINYVSARSGSECPLIDRIARVCCALCNLCDSVVPFD